MPCDIRKENISAKIIQKNVCFDYKILRSSVLNNQEYYNVHTLKSILIVDGIRMIEFERDKNDVAILLLFLNYLFPFTS